jgi:lipopolysaccharide/colanic/teichoic acid biosynthesis glycosyltransferase
MDKLDATRIADFILSTIFISWVLPLWVIVIPVLRFTGEGEVFYRQPRVGKDGQALRPAQVRDHAQG